MKHGETRCKTDVQRCLRHNAKQGRRLILPDRLQGRCCGKGLSFLENKRGWSPKDNQLGVLDNCYCRKTCVLHLGGATCFPWPSANWPALSFESLPVAAAHLGLFVLRPMQLLRSGYQILNFLHLCQGTTSNKFGGLVVKLMDTHRP